MSLGFIILRNVRDKITNEYWIECYTCLRKHYPSNKIMIIDDNSNYDFITEIQLENTVIINSVYKGRGELLPYIYYLRNPIFDRAVIIHDSIFFQKHVEFTDDNAYLFHFPTLVENMEIEEFLISKLNNMQPLLDLYKKMSWFGCFGSMSIISITLLREIDSKYNLENLIEHVKNRDDRMGFERVIGVILHLEKINRSVFGCILKYCKWNYSYSSYLDAKTKINLPNLPVIKVWTGR